MPIGPGTVNDGLYPFSFNVEWTGGGLPPFRIHPLNCAFRGCQEYGLSAASGSD